METKIVCFTRFSKFPIHNIVEVDVTFSFSRGKKFIKRIALGGSKPFFLSSFLYDQILSLCYSNPLCEKFTT